MQPAQFLHLHPATLHPLHLHTFAAFLGDFLVAFLATFLVAAFFAFFWVFLAATVFAKLFETSQKNSKFKKFLGPSSVPL